MARIDTPWANSGSIVSPGAIDRTRPPTRSATAAGAISHVSLCEIAWMSWGEKWS